MTLVHVDDWLTIHGGDNRDVMRTLPAETVQCVVTSPPYWGLRDYGTPGQLGLEQTPEAYVAAMVDVFREVRRVLRADGTLWLNLGSSYMNGGPSGPQGATGQRASRTFTASGLGSGAVGASGRSRTRQPERALACGTDGTGPLGCSAPGCACSGLCDGCLAARSSRTIDTLRPLPEVASLLSPTDRDTEPRGSAPVAPDASPPGARVSTIQLSEPLQPGPCLHCDNCGACLSVTRSPSRDARLCVRRSVDTTGRGSPMRTSDAGIRGKEPSGLAWGDYTSTLRPKDMVPIPWMVAMALQADGWYLRSDIIWAKPNPMPESVTDRPTKAHEYLFLLSKSERYCYDAAAVMEPSIYAGTVVKASDAATAKNGQKGQYGATALGFTQHDTVVAAGRNRRSVWTIATKPYPGAHFATFPEALVEPCILAGAPEGSLVMDPFGGTGTVGVVAQRLSRRALLIDLNPDYLVQCLDRNRQTPLGLTA